MSLLTSINFLFLTSLAITSWVILCYFHKIEEHKLVDDLRTGLRMEQVLIDEELVNAAVTKCQSNSYDIYLNVLCIFACIFGLAKITNFTENYVVRRLHSKFAYGYPGIDYKNKVQNLMVQVMCLEKQNKFLECRLQVMQQSRLQLHLSGETGTDDNEIDNVDGGGGGSGGGFIGRYDNIPFPNYARNLHNIFISNKHIHMNRHIFINEGNMRLNVNSNDANGGDFADIWPKYLTLQQMANSANNVDDYPPPPNNAYQKPCPFAPVVMSMDDLNNTADLYKSL